MLHMSTICVHGHARTTLRVQLYDQVKLTCFRRILNDVLICRRLLPQNALLGIDKYLFSVAIAA
jgi:hypothetical protein